MPESAVGRGALGRAKRWAKGTEQLLARLNDDQMAALRRARAGWPPGFVLGRHDAPDTGSALDPPFQAIEEIARELLRGYDWPQNVPQANGQDRPDWPASGYIDRQGFEDWHHVGPDWRPKPGKSRLLYDQASDRVCPRYDKAGAPIEGRPDLRREMLDLLQVIAESRESLANQHIESAMLRAMTIGAMFCRLAMMTLDGAAIARGAANVLLKSRSAEAQRENWTEKLVERDKYIQECDTKLATLKSKSSRATRIKSGWVTNGVREKGLDKWVAETNGDLPPDEHVQTLSVDRISRMLAERT